MLASLRLNQQGVRSCWQLYDSLLRLGMKHGFGEPLLASERCVSSLDYPQNQLLRQMQTIADTHTHTQMHAQPRALRFQRVWHTHTHKHNKNTATPTHSATHARPHHARKSTVIATLCRRAPTHFHGLYPLSQCCVSACLLFDGLQGAML